jgi:hypothetical protein
MSTIYYIYLADRAGPAGEIEVEGVEATVAKIRELAPTLPRGRFIAHVNGEDVDYDFDGLTDDAREIFSAVLSEVNR